MAGVPIPLAVVQHQLVWTDPLPELAADAAEEIVHPILRHQDMSMYYRQRGDRYALGNYRHEPILFDPEHLRPCAATASRCRRSSRSRPRTSGSARRPARGSCRHAGRVDRDTAINGMFSFTPDMGSVVGESADVRGLWIVRGGVGHARRRHGAAWSPSGWPTASRRMDLAEADANRFYPYMTTPPYVRGARERSSTARSTTSSIRSSR